MLRSILCWLVIMCLWCAPRMVLAGPFSGHSNDPGRPDSSIHFTDPAISAWATSVVNYSPAPGVNLEFQDTSNVLGPADATTTQFPNVSTVSLGDLDQTQISAGAAPGSITLATQQPVSDRSGPDFAVFENSFDGTFAGDASLVFGEMAYVEVSSDGVTFARFSSLYTNLETELNTSFGRDFAFFDPTNVNNLAGKHLAGWGTPFDLADLLGDAAIIASEVDLSNISFIRLIDVPGSGDFFDALGNPIFDSWVSQQSGGLDLDAIGFLSTTVIPEPATAVTAGLALMSIVLLPTRWRRGGGGRLSRAKGLQT